jgi:XTP/dITP diphosphohydrolase
MDVAVVTSNPGKFREIAHLLRRAGISSRRVDRALPEIQADRLEPVVRAKLAALGGRSGWSLVDDSGLFVSALRGFPGVYSAYVYRTLGYEPLLRWLDGRPRDAIFRTVAGLRYGNRTRLFVGATRGTIARRPRGRGGFGFDPVFVPHGSARTYAEMSLQEKERVSHRARALRGVVRAIRGGAPAPDA